MYLLFGDSRREQEALGFFLEGVTLDCVEVLDEIIKAQEIFRGYIQRREVVILYQVFSVDSEQRTEDKAGRSGAVKAVGAVQIDGIVAFVRQLGKYVPK